jgi:hypothetical protein
MTNCINFRIYKIWSSKGSNIYVGSTTSKKTLNSIFSNIKSDYKRKSNVSYSIIFDEYGVENCFIELIEDKQCKDKEETKILENFYIKKLHCVNKNIKGRTTKQYSLDNRDKIYESKEKYLFNNKEKIKKKKMNKMRNEFKIKEIIFLKNFPCLL